MNPRIWLIIGCVVAVAGAAWYILHTGYKLCEGDVAVANIEKVETHADIEKKVMHLPDADLRKRLSRWMRD